MTRDLTSAVNTAAAGEQARVVVLVELDFASGFSRLSTGDRDVLFDSDGDGNDETFLGVGDLGRISVIEETTELQVSGVSVALTGIPVTYLDVALDDDPQGRAARIWLAFLDESYAVIADPVLAFTGRMDVLRVSLGETATVEVAIESRFADWDRPRIRRYTDQDQKAQFPGDEGFAFVSQTTEKEIVWGLNAGK